MQKHIYEKSMYGQSSNITGRHLLSLLHDFQNLLSGLKSVRWKYQNLHIKQNMLFETVILKSAYWVTCSLKPFK